MYLDFHLGFFWYFSVFIGGNTEGIFEIDNEGRIKTVKGLDREKISVYEMTVKAEDRGGVLTFVIFVNIYGNS